MARAITTSAALLLLTCAPPGPDSDGEVLFNLVAELDSAEVQVETSILDLGTAAARDHLGRGWSWNETGADGTSFVWSLSRPAEVLFLVNQSQPLEVRIRCRPFRDTERSVSGLSLWINETRAAELALHRGWQEHRVSVPVEAVQSGLNTLSLDPIWASGPPPDSSAGGGRPLAVAFDWIEFGSARPTVPSSDAVRETLTLAAGSRVDYFLDSSRDSVLVIDSVTGGDGPTARLDISVDQDQKQGHQLVSSAGSPEGLVIPLPHSPQPLRLRFESHGATFELGNPRIMASLAEPQPETRSDARTTSRPTRSIQDPERIAKNRRIPPLVILYLIDTLRADHLSVLDYPRNTSPGLDSLIEEAVVFENTIAQSSWTKSSVGSILTGRLPWTHGGERLRDALVDDFDLLAQFLHRQGFQTGAFIANGMISEAFGFDRGWDRFEMLPQARATAGDIHRAALDWLDSLPKEKPVFLYLHTVEPHTPYEPAAELLSRFAGDDAGHLEESPIGSVESMRRLADETASPADSLVEDLIDLYDGEIAGADVELSRLIDELRERQLFDPSLFVLVSDHGEEFYDHAGWTHGKTLYRESLAVPFIVRFPGSRFGGTRIATRAQHIDVLPTLLDYLDIDLPSDLPGESLMCVVEQSEAASHFDCPATASRPIFSGIHYYNNHSISVISGDWKLIVDRIDALDRNPRLFNVVLDPEERVDVADAYPVLTGYLSSLMRRELEQSSHRQESVEVELDSATEKRLEALGYLH
ncbi:MAG: sulfatase [Acidobacteriota bacterium]